MEHFLQSKEWERFQKLIGRKTWRVQGMLIVKLPLIFSRNYLYAAGETDLRLKIKDLRDELKALSKKENAVFFKFEPLTGDKNLSGELLEFGFKKSAKSLQPQRTIILDITKSEEDILKQMSQKTRYNVRLTSRKGLRFAGYDLKGNENVFNNFFALLQKTSVRDGFYTHEKNYYKKLLEVSLVKLFGVEYDNKLIAASIVLFYGDRAYYLHGASDYEYRNLMAPYLLHWETIKLAKTKGFKQYDFWGVDAVKWPGVTRFKRGFGGREVEYIGSYYYVFQSLWYNLYLLRQKLLRKD